MNWQEEIYRDGDGNVHPITWNQTYAIWRGLLIWRNTASKWYPENYGYLLSEPPKLVDMEKSCLLGRILIDAKEPLPEPPPTAWAAPWYYLIENGSSQLNSSFSFGGPYERDDKTVVIVAGCLWDLVDTEKNDIYIRFTRYNPTSDIFRIRQLKKDEAVSESFDFVIERVI